MLIRTPRLLLRPLELGDLDDFHALDQADGVLSFLRTTHRTREESEAGLRRCLAVNSLHHGMGWFAAVDAAQGPSEGSFLGWFHLRAGAEGDIFTPELGYRLHPDHWGQGLATEGSRALLEHAFDQLSARTVTAETMVVNAASRRVMERIGMRKCSHRPWPHEDPVPGREEGVVEYRITLDEWLETYPDTRRQLHRAQAQALRAKDQAALDRLRATGMALARVEAGGIRASDDLVAELARKHEGL